MVPILIFLMVFILLSGLGLVWFVNTDPKRLRWLAHLFMRIRRYGIPFRLITLIISFVTRRFGILTIKRILLALIPMGLLASQRFGVLGIGLTVLFLVLMFALGFVLTRLWRTHQKRAASPSTGKSTETETGWLRMRLDHDTGIMEGVVLHGPYEGRSLSSMTEPELLLLLQTFQNVDEASERLLKAWLDRNLGPDWRQNAQKSGSDRMTPAAARAILGLTVDATREMILAAYRRLIWQHHPDRGGDPLMAARLNEAKRILLGE